MSQIKLLERVRELMMDQKLDTENEMLVLDIAIIYTQAQQDYIKEQGNYPLTTGKYLI